MDILLIDPPYKSLKGVVAESGYVSSLVSLAGFLRENGLECGVLTCDLLLDYGPSQLWDFDVEKYAKGQTEYKAAVSDDNHEIWKKLGRYIEEYNPLAVGITYLTPCQNSVNQAAKIIKMTHPETTVIVGGHHPSFSPVDVLENPDIDYVVSGEGELALTALVKNLKNRPVKPENIPGIYYRKEHQVLHNPPGPLIKNLDDLPFAALDLIIDCDFKKYSRHMIGTARGCPYNCSFCSDRRLWNNRVRRRSIDHVINEIKHLIKTRNPSGVDIIDGTFTYDRSYAVQFCDRLIEEGLEFKWHCTARYDNLDLQLIEKLKQAGCAALYFGLESGSQDILASINKRTTLKGIIETSEMVAQSGLTSIVSVLVGLPQETRQDLESTLSLMESLAADIFDINNYIPLPGTAFYDDMSAEQKENIDWGSVGYKSFDNYFTPHMSHEMLNQYLKQAYKIAGRKMKLFQEKMGQKQK